jgi:NADH-quinone oxidoreductase subunit A
MLEVYAAIGATILLVLLVVGAILIVAHALGPKRHGPVKDSPYESGMPVVGDARRRFHVQFYVVAVLFLLFDVEVVFLWPWARVYHHAATTGATMTIDGGLTVGKGFLLGGMALFLAILVVGLAYEWKKGAFRWD